MYSRQKRETFDVYVGNIPKSVNEKEIIKKFSVFGETLGIITRPDKKDGKYTIIRYLCEPDANKAIAECNNIEWNGNIIAVSRKIKKISISSEKELRNKFQKFPEYSFGNFKLATTLEDCKQYKNKMNLQSTSNNNNVNNQPGVIEILCTSIEDPITFYGNPILKLEELQTLSFNLQCLCSTFPRLETAPDTTEFYAALFSEDKIWYRCIVVNSIIPLKPGMCTVCYVDYGNREDVHYSDIVQLPESMRKIPPLAIKCILSCLVLEENNSNSTKEFLGYLEDLLIGQRLSLGTYTSLNKPVYYAVRCSCNGIDVVEKIIEKGIAKYKHKSTNKEAFQAKLNKTDETKFQSEEEIKLINKEYLQEAKFKSEETHQTQDLKIEQNINKSSVLSKSNLHSSYGTIIADNCYPSPFFNLDSTYIGPSHRGRPISGINNHNYHLTEITYKNKPIYGNYNAIANKTKSEINRNGTNMHNQKAHFYRNKFDHDKSTEETTQISRINSENKVLRQKLHEEYSHVKDLKNQIDLLQKQISENSLGSKIDNIAGNLKVVRKIRELIFAPNSTDIIDSAISILKFEKDKAINSLEILNKVKLSVKLYFEVFNKIKECSDKNSLQSLAKEKDLLRENLIKDLETYLNEYNYNLKERKNAIQKICIDLQNNLNTYLDVYIEQHPSSIDEIFSLYLKIKEQRKIAVNNARLNTDMHHASLMEFFMEMHKTFSLNVSDDDQHLNISSESLSSKFNKSLTDTNIALSQEMEVYASNNNEPKTFSVIQLLLDELVIFSQKIEEEFKHFEKYSSLYKDLCTVIESGSIFMELANIRKSLKAVKSKLRHKLADKKDIEENEEESESDLSAIESEINMLQYDLHSLLNEEDNLIKTLAIAAESSLPELNVEHPELNLAKYFKFNFLVKFGWDPEHFTFKNNTSRLGITYNSIFLSSPVVIKEFLHENEDKLEDFIDRVVQWNNINSNCLIKIKAIFNQGNRNTYIVITSNHQTLLEAKNLDLFANVAAKCNFLLDILEGLKDLHSHHMIHGALDPNSVLYDNQKGLLDFCFEVKNKANSSKINFHLPNNLPLAESSDMYSYGCLVLWFLFPNLIFQNTIEGTPNLSEHKNIVKELLTEEDYVLLFSLLHSKPENKPSSNSLIKCNFLKSTLSLFNQDKTSVNTNLVKESVINDENSVLIKESCSINNIILNEDENQSTLTTFPLDDESLNSMCNDFNEEILSSEIDYSLSIESNCLLSCQANELKNDIIISEQSENCDSGAFVIDDFKIDMICNNFSSSNLPEDIYKDTKNQ